MGSRTAAVVIGRPRSEGAVPGGSSPKCTRTRKYPRETPGFWTWHSGTVPNPLGDFPIIAQGTPEAPATRWWLLSELKSFDVPPYNYHQRRKTRTGVLGQQGCVITTGSPVPIHQVRVEEHAGDFIPDIVIESATTSFIVEVAVTHKVERIKLRKLRRRNLPAIEIRLQAEDSFLPRDALKRKLQQDLPCKVWLFHPDQRHADRIFALQYRRALAQARHRPLVTSARTSHRPHPSTHLQVPRPSATNSSWWEQNRFGEQFNRRHGRYPSIEECQTLRPDLFGKKEPGEGSSTTLAKGTRS
jgi:hypothetical protein